MKLAISGGVGNDPTDFPLNAFQYEQHCIVVVIVATTDVGIDVQVCFSVDFRADSEIGDRVACGGLQNRWLSLAAEFCIEYLAGGSHV